jgi:hypothetical protein
MGIFAAVLIYDVKRRMVKHKRELEVQEDKLWNAKS